MQCGERQVEEKWPDRLLTSSGGDTSTWNDVEAELAKHHFNQAHDILLNIRSITVDPDYFETVELEYAVESPAK